MSNIQIFNFENSQQIRIINQNGEFWFVANDVCNILEIQNTSNALKTLDDDEKAKLENTPRLNLGLHKGVKQINIINESGLYALILRSRKAMEKGTVQHKFRKWVTSEVLPAIRKTGSYRHTTAHDRTPLRQAVTALSGKLGIIHSEAYALVHQYMGVEHIDEIAMSDLPRAVEYVHRLMMGQPAHGEENAFWRMVGVLEYRRISNELTELQESLDTVSRKLNRIVKTKGLLYDSLGEQRHVSHDPNLVVNAQEFIDRQMVMKKQIGLI